MNMIVTNNIKNGPVIQGDDYEDIVLNAPGAVTYAAGTVLGRLTANGKMVAYAEGGAGGAEVPKMVLPVEVVFTGAGDQSLKALSSGRVRADRLIEHGVGAITDAAVFDELRDYTIIVVTTTELSQLDNQ
jgi:hypothetical protein